ncbi:hypothetical protein [Xenorhabdus cabanillasii]|uniref:hypothetical protein n=1 Tax=Xenorhabdus cabanillasii TaxID=351673 RepID=UPI000E27F7F8|nr:hypothetical protein [Xenorhabdus cabanillasii]
MSGYERALELLTANPFPTNQLDKNIYGIRKRDVPNYINRRIAALRREEGREDRIRENVERENRERRGN